MKKKINKLFVDDVFGSQYVILNQTKILKSIPRHREHIRSRKL